MPPVTDARRMPARAAEIWGAPAITVAGEPPRQGPLRSAGFPQLLAAPSGGQGANFSGVH